MASLSLAPIPVRIPEIFRADERRLAADEDERSCEMDWGVPIRESGVPAPKSVAGGPDAAVGAAVLGRIVSSCTIEEERGRWGVDVGRCAS